MSTPEAPKKEISTEVRTVIAFLLMGVILLATPYVYRMIGISTSNQNQTQPLSADAPKKSIDVKSATAETTGAGRRRLRWLHRQARRLRP